MACAPELEGFTFIYLTAIEFTFKDGYTVQSLETFKHVWNNLGV